MADPVSLASGILTLAAFAMQSTKILYEVIENYRNNSRTVRELKEELEALEVVLGSLLNVPNDEQIDLSVLKLPLLRCGEACRNLADTIDKCTARSNGDKASFRDWFKLTYRGKDIASFRNVIAAYKSTIAIALADANIRHSNVTAQLLREYKKMIDNTTSDLQEILEQADDELAKSTLENSLLVPGDSNDLNQSAIEEERASIDHCLSICKQVASHLEQAQAEIFITAKMRDGNDSRARNVQQSPARLITNEKLRDCKTGLKFTVSELRIRLQDADHRLQKLLHQSGRENDVDPVFLPKQTPEDLESIKQCLAICEEATEELARERINVFEDVHMTDDAHQVIVATLGDLISAKHISTGARSKQWLGQMSDASLQQLSKDNVSSIGNAVREETMSRVHSQEDLQNTDPDKVRSPTHYRFEGQHGTGRKLG